MSPSSKLKFHHNEAGTYTRENTAELIVKERVEPGDRLKITVITTVTTDSYKLYGALKKAKHELEIKWKD